MVPTLVAKLAESVVSICPNASVASSHEHNSEIPPTEDCHRDSVKSLLFDPPPLSVFSVFKNGFILPGPFEAWHHHRAARSPGLLLQT